MHTYCTYDIPLAKVTRLCRIKSMKYSMSSKYGEKTISTKCILEPRALCIQKDLLIHVKQKERNIRHSLFFWLLRENIVFGYKYRFYMVRKKKVLRSFLSCVTFLLLRMLTIFSCLSYSSTEFCMQESGDMCGSKNYIRPEYSYANQVTITKKSPL